MGMTGIAAVALSIERTIAQLSDGRILANEMVLMQFALNPERRPRIAKEVLLQNRERPDAGTQPGPTGLSTGEVVDRRLNVASGRYRSRFCNDSP
jgi:hypothetical protein